MKQGYHVSPVAYKRTGTRVKGATLKRRKPQRQRVSRSVEVCTECGSDQINRQDGRVACNNCNARYLLAETEAPHRKLGSVWQEMRGIARHCFQCDAPIGANDYHYTSKAYARSSNSTVTLYYCERHPPRVHTSSRAFRKEQSMRRRQRDYRPYQKHVGRAAEHKLPSRKRRKKREPDHHAAVKAAKREGWAKVDGVWQEVA